MASFKELLEMQQDIVSFTETEAETLFKLGEELELSESEPLFQADDASDSVYLVKSGSINLFSYIGEDVKQTIMSVRQGGLVGAMAIMSPSTRGVGAEAAENTALYKFMHEDVKALVTEGNELGNKLLLLLNDVLSTRLQIAMNSLSRNLEWTIEVAGLANLDLRQIIIDQVPVRLELINGKQLTGTIMKAEEQPSGTELFVKTDDNWLHVVPYHAIVSASLPLEAAISSTDDLLGM